VRDVTTGQDLPDVIERTRACSLTWLPDGNGFYYTRYPAPGSVAAGEENYHRHVYLHWLGSDPALAPHVFGDGRPLEDWPQIPLSPDGRWLVVMEAKGGTQTEVYLKALHRPEAPGVPLGEQVPALFNVVARHDRLYVHTNEHAPRYRLFQVDP